MWPVEPYPDEPFADSTAKVSFEFELTFDGRGRPAAVSLKLSSSP